MKLSPFLPCYCLVKNHWPYKVSRSGFTWLCPRDVLQPTPLSPYPPFTYSAHRLKTECKQFIKCMLLCVVFFFFARVLHTLCCVFLTTTCRALTLSYILILISVFTWEFMFRGMGGFCCSLFYVFLRLKILKFWERWILPHQHLKFCSNTYLPE